MQTKITTEYKNLPIGSKCLELDGKEPRVLMKVSSIEKDGVQLNCLDMGKGVIFNKDETSEVFWLNVE